MDFIELLKSFGLDMSSVANALGIDIHTLNNMDHEELLNLLTQQASWSWEEDWSQKNVKIQCYYRVCSIPTELTRNQSLVDRLCQMELRVDLKRFTKCVICGKTGVGIRDLFLHRVDF